MMEGTEPYLGILLEYAGNAGQLWLQPLQVRPACVPQSSSIGLIGAGNHVRDRLLGPLQKIAGTGFAGSAPAPASMPMRWPRSSALPIAPRTSGRCWRIRKPTSVVIGTRHGSHARMVIESLEAGKHVFVEKPLCLTEDELAQIAEHLCQARPERVCA